MFVTAELRSAVQKNLVKVDECSYWLATHPFGKSEQKTVDSGSITDFDTAFDPDNTAPNHALTSKLAAERALHVAIECTTDAANLVIDALVMREPGGYADILRVLMEEGVVAREWFRDFEGALTFRNRLVHNYIELTAEEVRHAALTYGPLLPVYTAALRSYLDIA